jgi:hypothetical protein
MDEDHEYADHLMMFAFAMRDFGDRIFHLEEKWLDEPLEV